MSLHRRILIIVDYIWYICKKWYTLLSIDLHVQSHSNQPQAIQWVPSTNWKFLTKEFAKVSCPLSLHFKGIAEDIIVLFTLMSSNKRLFTVFLDFVRDFFVKIRYYFACFFFNFLVIRCISAIYMPFCCILIEQHP